MEKKADRSRAAVQKTFVSWTKQWFDQLGFETMRVTIVEEGRAWCARYAPSASCDGKESLARAADSLPGDLKSPSRGLLTGSAATGTRDFRPRSLAVGGFPDLAFCDHATWRLQCPHSALSARCSYPMRLRGRTQLNDPVQRRAAKGDRPLQPVVGRGSSQAREKLTDTLLNRLEVRSVVQRRVDISTEVRGRLRILLMYDQDAPLAFGADEVAGFEDNIVPWRLPG